MLRREDFLKPSTQGKLYTRCWDPERKVGLGGHARKRNG